MQRRVVITGLGVVAPNGIGKENFWNACISGRSGIRPVTHFDASPLPTRIAGEVADFEPETFGITPEEARFIDRNTQFALAAANLALEDAGLLLTGQSTRSHGSRSVDRTASSKGPHGQALRTPSPGRRPHPSTKPPPVPTFTPLPPLREAERDQMGVYIGSAMASLTAGEQLWCQVTDRGAHSPRDTLLADCLAAQQQHAVRWQSERFKDSMNGLVPVTLLLTHAPAAAIAAHHQLHGPCMVIATGCSAGADAIGEAFWAIQEGQADCMLAGGSDSAISYGGFAAFCVLGAMSTRNEEPESASCPYDRRRDGFVMAEGAGVVVLEERERALARNAHIYAEMIAFASNSNSHHMTALPADGEPLQRLLRQTLEEAEITPEQLGYINSHGSSTPTNDSVETAAYKSIFGEYAYRIPISATKSMIGHTQGAASAIETVVTALVLERQVIPPTINQQYLDPLCDLDYVPNAARHAVVDVALTHSSGFGGVNNALILSRADWRDR